MEKKINEMLKKIGDYAIIPEDKLDRNDIELLSFFYEIDKLYIPERGWCYEVAKKLEFRRDFSWL